MKRWKNAPANIAEMCPLSSFNDVTEEITGAAEVWVPSKVEIGEESDRKEGSRMFPAMKWAGNVEGVERNIVCRSSQNSARS